MRRLLFILILIVSGCLGIAAQTANCPKITITGPPGITMPGDRMTFSANVLSSAPLGRLEYAWTVTAGSVLRGQGTPNIEVLTTKEMQGSNVTASVKLKGVPIGCFAAASEVASIAPRLSGPHWLDEFGKLSIPDLRARLQNFYVLVNNIPTAEGIVIVKFDKKASRGRKVSHLNNIYNAIIWLKGDLTRVSFLISESDYEGTSVGPIPLGADLTDLGIDASKLIKGEDLKAKMKTLFPEK